MKYTIQEVTESGNFAPPQGDDVKHCKSWQEVRAKLEAWHYEVNRYSCTGGGLVVWKGHYDDVTDIYPDFVCSIGKRGGLIRQPC